MAEDSFKLVLLRPTWWPILVLWRAAGPIPCAEKGRLLCAQCLCMKSPPNPTIDASYALHWPVLPRKTRKNKSDPANQPLPGKQKRSVSLPTVRRPVVLLVPFLPVKLHCLTDQQ